GARNRGDHRPGWTHVRAAPDVPGGNLMATGVSVRIEGWEELERKLRQLGSTINERELLEGALMEGAGIVKGAIEQSAPYRTGQLRDSITISKKGREKYSVRIGPSGKGFYGRFLEYGTSQRPARPFM